MKFKSNIKIMLMVILILFGAVVLVLFENTSNAQTSNKSSLTFEIVSYDRLGEYYTAYDRETKVMYAIKHDFIIMLVDANGKPKLYKD